MLMLRYVQEQTRQDEGDECWRCGMVLLGVGCGRKGNYLDVARSSKYELVNAIWHFTNICGYQLAVVRIYECS